MGLVETGNSSSTKVSQLEAAAYQGEKFDMTVTFELDNGDLSTYKISCKGADTSFVGERVGYKGPSVHRDPGIAMDHLIHNVKVRAMKALVVKTTKGVVPAK